MKYFIEFVVRALVERIDEVDVAESDDGRLLRYAIRVHPDDIGKVIGRNGRTISALRNLCGAAASKLDKRVVVEIEDPTGGLAA